MRVCTFLAADVPLPPHAPSQAYPLCIDVEHETVYDGGVDDNFFCMTSPMRCNTPENNMVSVWYGSLRRAEPIK